MEPAIGIAPPTEKLPQRPDIRVPDHELLQVIGRGSYGEVWEARNLMGTPRAVKVVRRVDFDDARPFEREFEGIKHYEPVSRSHVGLVKVLHVGMHEEQGYFYYVMELADADEPVAGGGAAYVPRTLRCEMLRRGALPVPECVEIGITLASALSHLHSNGLVHRDVKPANIIIVDGAPQIADVGLVANLGDSGTMVGTEGYFAPEGVNQPGSDVFSLGKVLYECVTGMDRIRFPDVPETWGDDPEGRAAFEFMEIVLRAAEPNPERRYKRMDELLADLALVKAGRSVRHLRRVEKNLRRTLQVLAVAALAVAVVGGGWLYERDRRAQVERAEEAAQLATEETRKLLAESLVAEARAVRLSGKAGARENAVDAVLRGAGAGAEAVTLRSEAASALALLDVGEFSSLLPTSRPVGARTTLSDDGASMVVIAPDGSAQHLGRRGTDTWVLRNFSVAPGGIAAAVARGGHWLAVMNPDRSLAIWNLRSGGLSWQAPGSRVLSAMAFSHDGSWLVYSAPDGLVACASNGSGRTVIVPGAGAARYVNVAPDGTWVATLSDDAEEKGFRIYTGLSGQLPHGGDVDALTMSEISSNMTLEGPSVSADSRYLAAAVAEDRVRVWEISSLKQIATLRGHQRSVRGTAFHPNDSSVVASTSWDGTTRLWNIPTRQEVLVATTGGDGVVLLPERGEILLRTWGHDAIRVAPLSSASGLRVLMVPEAARSGLFSSVNFSPDGRGLIAAGDAGVVFWDLRSGATRLLHQSGPHVWRDAAFSHDGSFLWCSGHPGLVKHRVVGDPYSGEAGFDSGTKVSPLPSGHIDWVGSGDRLAVAGYLHQGEDGVRVLDRDGSQVQSLPASFATDRVAASPDGRWVAATRYPQAGGVLWDLSREPPMATEIEAESRCTFRFLSRSRPQMLAIATDREISFFSLPTARGGDRPNAGKLPRPLLRRDAEFVPGRVVESATAGLVAMTISPTGVLLCDADTLAPIATLDSPLTCFDGVLAFSPDGSRLALAGGVNRVLIWEIGWIREELLRLGVGW